MYVSSNGPADFTCSHIKSVSDSVDASGMFSLTAEKIASSPSDSTTKELLKKLVFPVGHQAVYKVTDRSYVVYGPPSATNTLGFFGSGAVEFASGQHDMKRRCQNFFGENDLKT